MAGSDIVEIDIKQLKQCPLFDGISDIQIASILKCVGAYSKIFFKKEYIALEDDDIRRIGVVLKGSIDMLKEDIWGNRTILARVKQNQLIGETFACGTDSKSYISFQANVDTEVLFLPFHRVMRTCSNNCEFHHRLILNMVELMANKNRMLMEKIDIVTKKTLQEKILAYLSLESQKQGSKYIEIPLKRVEMAEYLFSNRSAMTRELADMKNKGIIDFDGQTFHILQ